MARSPGEPGEAADLDRRCRELSARLPAADIEARASLAAELKRLGEKLALLRELERVRADLAGNRQLLAETADDQLRALADDERQTLEARERELAGRLERWSAAPEDPRDASNAIIEIRAGTGGEEAALFARDLFRMYCRFAERGRMKLEVFDSQPSERNGLRSVVFLVKQPGAFGRLKNESGVHRVQRVPETESGGRVHTSAATVAVLPETPAREVKLDPADLRIDLFCASGHGGQSVNTTYSAVRITHLPSGVVVSCQDERSQLQNKLRALKVLAARLEEMERRAEHQAQGDERRRQVGSGDRSEKIRTYNFPQNRLTDHRSGYASRNLRVILDGDLEALLRAAAGATGRGEHP